MTTVGSPTLYALFIAFILVMLALDLGVFHRKAEEVSFREAALWSVFWVALSLLFNVGVYWMFGSEKALEFLTGYVIEKALSVDNIFVFLVVFSYFRVPGIFQHRVLFYGILGALVMRGIFIFLGAELLSKFHWIEYLFGAFLVFTGIKMLGSDDIDVDPGKNKILLLARKIFRGTPDYHGQRFFVRIDHKLYVTPLFFVLLVVEATDLVFAVDSIPAVFAITKDPFIVFTSNIFAILGLRSLFFLLASVMGKLEYLSTGLAIVLAFVGVKMLIADFYKVPILLSLSMIGGILAVSVILSLIKLKRERHEEKAGAPELMSEEQRPVE